MQNEESHGPAKDGLGGPGPAAGPSAASAYLGQVEAFAFNFAPAGWLPCDGRTLPIMQNEPLYALLGTSYGGDGRVTLGLPWMAPLGPSGPHYFIATTGVFPPRS